jgi:hypothetical protein
VVVAGAAAAVVVSLVVAEVLVAVAAAEAGKILYRSQSVRGIIRLIFSIFVHYDKTYFSYSFCCTIFHYNTRATPRQQKSTLS